MIEKPANGVRGYFLTMPDGRFVFRIYTSVDRKEWEDYEVRHHDLEVEIVDNYSSFFQDGDKKYLDYPSRLTKKVTTAEPAV